jgi:hypothetical protein
MPDEKTVVRRFRKSPFVLDKPKLARIMDILEQRFTEARLEFRPTFEITLKRGRTTKTTSVDQLLGFDNSVANPITDLTITVEESWQDSSENDLSCKLEFYNRSVPYINLEVASSQSKRASQSFAELEEQIERTLTSGWMYKLTPPNVIVWFAGLFVTMLFAALLFLPKGNDVKENSAYALTTEEIHSFAQRAKTTMTTEEKIDFLFALQTQQLERSLKPRGTVIRFSDIGKLLTLKTLFISLPLILIIVCLIYLRRNSYPNAVFLWGDWEEHYSKVISMRKTIWTVLIGAFFVGILGNLFVYGLSLR